MCPQTTPVATKSHLCGPKHTRVTTKASCLSSAHIFVAITIPSLSQPTMLVKSPLLWSSAYPCSQKRSQVVLSLRLYHHSTLHPQLNHVSTKSHNCGPQLTAISTIAYLVVSVYPYSNHNSLCPKPTPVATTHHCRHHSNPADTIALHVASIPQRP